MAEFPFAAFLEAIRTKNQNQQQMMQQFGQGIAGVGQGIGQGLQRGRQQRAQTAFGQQLSNMAQPVQGPPTQSGQMPQQLPPDIGKLFGMAGQAYPGQEGSIMPGIMEMLKGKKPVMEWQVAPGMLSKAGHPLIFDKATGQMKESDQNAVASGGSQMAGVRKQQFTMQDLPSNQGPNTAAGAAYQVKVAARQGKNLIAKSGSAQRIGLASGDLARSVLRAAPTDEAMRNSNFSDNMIQHWNQLKQKLTSDPTAVNNPAIRREMYNLFDEMDRSATPFIQNQLDDMESVGFPVPPQVRKRQMGLTLPDIPFIEIPGQPSPFQKPGASGGLTPEEQAEFSVLDARFGGKK